MRGSPRFGKPGNASSTCIVAFGEIGALMRAARFLPGQSAEGYRLGGVQQEPELQCRRQLRVEAQAFVL